MRHAIVVFSAVFLAGSAAAQPAIQPIRQSMAEAVAQDAEDYARRHDVTLPDAIRRLRALEDSVAATDRLVVEYRERLAGISIQHRPDFRIIVLLAGDAVVPEQSVRAGGLDVPVAFRSGAPATRRQLLDALEVHQPAIRAAYPNAQGMGIDQRTGELVLMLKGENIGFDRARRIEAEVELLTAVPVRVRLLDRPDSNMAVEGGARVVGVDPADGRTYACTTGFPVTDGTRDGMITAAHCPDAATYLDADGSRVPLEFVGQWGARTQDVQVHVAGAPIGPFFYADRARRSSRPVTAARARTSTRAGDTVCRFGEATGYSCSEVELTDFSPPGALCAGPCEPVWVTVTGPNCRNGDSGGPIFSGTTAFGITKGGSYTSGRCNFYYYMSTDFLPDGWRLRTGGDAERRVVAEPRTRLFAEGLR
jgi:hypothetical protein